MPAWYIPSTPLPGICGDWSQGHAVWTLDPPHVVGCPVPVVLHGMTHVSMGYILVKGFYKITILGPLCLNGYKKELATDAVLTSVPPHDPR